MVYVISNYPIRNELLLFITNYELSQINILVQDTKVMKLQYFRPYLPILQNFYLEDYLFPGI